MGVGRARQAGSDDHTQQNSAFHDGTIVSPAGPVLVPVSVRRYPPTGGEVADGLIFSSHRSYLASVAVRHYVFLIHGTWGKDQAGWYQPSAPRENFAKRLAARLTGTPLEGAVWNDARVFEWSGENTHWGRIKAAIDLGDMLLRIRFAQPSERPRFHFIAHSHGGNVLLAALIRYVTQLPVALVHAMKFPYFVSTDDQAREFFTAVRRLVLETGFHPDNEIIRQDPQLQGDVRNWLNEVERRYRLFTAGRLGLTEQWGLSGMMAKVALFLLRMSTFRDEHGIASTVFLGTPFYYKQWRADWRRRALDRVANALGEASMTGLGTYIAVLLGAGLTSWLSWTSWVGFNPLQWPLWAHIGLGAGIACGAFDGARRVPGDRQHEHVLRRNGVSRRGRLQPVDQPGRAHAIRCAGHQVRLRR